MTKARDLANFVSGTNSSIGTTQIDDDAVTNAKIANESITINGSAINLGGTVTVGETKPTVSSVSPSTITNDATNITITGTNFVAIPRVDIINTATGIWYSANTVTHNSATSITVNVTLPVDANTYRIRVENPDGLAGLSSANFLTVSDLPTWTTSAGSLGSVAGNTNGAVATVAASGDSITYSEVTNVLTNASLANCSLNSSTGAITSTDFDGSSTSARTHTFTLRATDAQGQTADREFSLTSSYFTSASVSYLVIAGGGGGGGDGETVGGAGGGAGGYRNSYASESSGGGGSTETPLTFSAGITYTITVGAGGTGNPSRSAGTNGGNSSISGSDITDVVAIGGGRAASTQGQAGQTGGSGGGGSYGGAAGSGTSNQGYAGGTGSASGGYQSSGGAGGGAGGAGGNSTANSAGNGGAGLTSAITGSSVARAGGGAAGSSGSYSQGSASAGGGAAGAHGGNNNGQAGTANTGGGGGGGSTSGYSQAAGGDGGSGIVILRMPTTAFNSKTAISGTYTTATVGSDTVISYTAGTGTIAF